MALSMAETHGRWMGLKSWARGWQVMQLRARSCWHAWLKQHQSWRSFTASRTCLMTAHCLKRLRSRIRLLNGRTTRRARQNLRLRAVRQIDDLHRTAVVQGIDVSNSPVSKAVSSPHCADAIHRFMREAYIGAVEHCQSLLLPVVHCFDWLYLEVGFCFSPF